MGRSGARPAGSGRRREAYPRGSVSEIQKSAWVEGLLKSKTAKAAKYVLPRRVCRRIYFGIRSRNLEKPVLGAEIRQRLVDLHRPDILSLQHLIGRDLSRWLTGGPLGGDEGP